MTKFRKSLKLGTCVAGLSLFSVLLIGPAALGQEPPQADQPSQGPAPGNSGAMGDAKFAKKAARGGMAEVKMGQLAQEKGGSDVVKQFGQRMIDDHTKAGEQLKAAAMKENITLPNDVSPKDKATYDALWKLSGAEFDRAYARDMVKDHTEDVSDFNSEATSGQSPAIKQFATETLPTLQDHLKQAKDMRRSVSAGNDSKRNAESNNQ